MLFSIAQRLRITIKKAQLYAVTIIPFKRMDISYPPA